MPVHSPDLCFEMSADLGCKLDTPHDREWLHEDMEYIRKRISTNRSMITGSLGMYQSRFYEGAKTLIDVAEVFMNGCPMFRPTSCKVAVIPAKRSEFIINGCTASKTMRRSGDCCLEVTYTCDHQKGGESDDEYPLGYFIVRLKMNNANTTKETTVGDIDLKEICPDVRSDDRVFMANPNGILGYSECFPITSMFARMMETAWNSMYASSTSTDQEE